MKANLKDIMKAAWSIARKAAGEFGGSVREFFAQSLKNAWIEAKLSNLDIAIKAAKDAQAKFSRTVNEGGYGYNPHDSKIMDLVIEKSKVWHEYMLANSEYFRERWNSAVRKHAKNDQLDGQAIKKIESDVGMTFSDARWLKEQMTK